MPEVTDQQLIDASTDATNYAAVVNGGANDPDVVMRSGVSVPTLAKVAATTAKGDPGNPGAPGAPGEVSHASLLAAIDLVSDQRVTRGGNEFNPATFTAGQWLWVDDGVSTHADPNWGTTGYIDVRGCAFFIANFPFEQCQYQNAVGSPVTPLPAYAPYGAARYDAAGKYLQNFDPGENSGFNPVPAYRQVPTMGADYVRLTIPAVIAGAAFNPQTAMVFAGANPVMTNLTPYQPYATNLASALSAAIAPLSAQVIATNAAINATTATAIAALLDNTAASVGPAQGVQLFDNAKMQNGFWLWSIENTLQAEAGFIVSNRMLVKNCALLVANFRVILTQNQNAVASPTIAVDQYPGYGMVFTDANDQNPTHIAAGDMSYLPAGYNGNSVHVDPYTQIKIPAGAVYCRMSISTANTEFFNAATAMVFAGSNPVIPQINPNNVCKGTMGGDWYIPAGQRIPVRSFSTPYVGLNAGCLGDSYSAGAGADFNEQYNYHADVATMLGANFHTRLATSGISANQVFDPQQALGYQAALTANTFAGCDYIVIALGENVHASGIGSWADAPVHDPTSGSSVYATFKYLLEFMLTSYPTVRLIGVIALTTANNNGANLAGPINSTGAQGAPQNQNSRNIDKALHDVYADCYQRYGIPYIDLFATSGITGINQASYLSQTDYVHPTDSTYLNVIVPLVARGLLAAAR